MPLLAYFPIKVCKRREKGTKVREKKPFTTKLEILQNVDNNITGGEEKFVRKKKKITIAAAAAPCLYSARARARNSTLVRPGGCTGAQ